MRHSRIATRVRLACVRPAASVRSEPGSNSQVDRVGPIAGSDQIITRIPLALIACYTSSRTRRFAMKGSMHRSDERARCGKPRRHAAACASLSCSSLVKIAVPDLASVANNSVRLEASSGGGHARVPGINRPGPCWGAAIYARGRSVSNAFNDLLSSPRCVAARGPLRRRAQGLQETANNHLN